MKSNSLQPADTCQCGGRTEVTSRRHVGPAVRRYRKCLSCSSKFSTIKCREPKRDTLAYGTGWRALSNSIRKRDLNMCQVCFKEHGDNLPVDHIIPFRISKCNLEENLITLEPMCYAGKRTAEDHLKEGDRLGFERELRVRGWDMNRVAAAFEAWGSMNGG